MDLAPVPPERQRAALLRGLLLLACATLLAFGAEFTWRVGYQPVTGTVLALHQSDRTDYEIEWHWQDHSHRDRFRLGIIDSFRFDQIKPGDTIDLAIAPDAPNTAVIDSFNARHPITLSMLAFCLVLVIVLAIRSAQGWRPVKARR
jgi:hypothetical protein